MRRARHLFKWIALTVPPALVIGSLVALFLVSLDAATRVRFNYPWLLYLLPLAGILVGWLYHAYGKSVEAGNDLILEQIHEPGGGVPARMTPLVLITTLLTHLFGGSAGREGTAVQMGGSVASEFGRRLKLDSHDTRILLMTGVAAGFGAVFGTPLAGAIFAIEVLSIGKMSYEALIPCLIASIVGDWTVAAWGVHHTTYAIGAIGSSRLDLLLLAKVALAGVVFGLVGVVFVRFTHGVRQVLRFVIPSPLLRPFVGGCVLIILTVFLGTRDYLGLGVLAEHVGAVTIPSCFTSDGATNWSWFWKIVFTGVTLGAGFKGGEVTPLFFIGAATGNVIARLTGAPVDLMAGLGFVAVFAGATNAPLACIILGLELFGASAGNPIHSGLVVYLAVACCVAYAVSGHKGIYHAQRVGRPKVPAPPRTGP